jgi:triosephosphate isomerase
MKKPIIIINFKTYKKGKENLDLARMTEKVDKNIIVGVPASDIKEIASKTKLKVYAEHVDPFPLGRNTGYIIPEEVKAGGAAGTFLNHSEHKLDFKTLKETMKRCKKIGLKTAVFASSLSEAKKIERLKPNFLIYEPPELVGGDISVSTAKPEIIKKISKSLKMKFLVGAGVKTYNDMETSMKLGATGVAIASGVTEAENPKREIEKLLGR